MKYKIVDKGYMSSGYGVGGKALVLSKDGHGDIDYKELVSDENIKGISGIWSENASAEQLLDITKLSGGTISQIYANHLKTSEKQFLNILSIPGLSSISVPGLAYKQTPDEGLYLSVLKFLTENKNPTIKNFTLYYRDEKGNSTADYYNKSAKVLRQAEEMFAGNTHLKTFYIAGNYEYTDPQKIVKMIKTSKTIQSCDTGNHKVNQELASHFIKNKLAAALLSKEYDVASKLLTNDKFLFDEDMAELFHEKILPLPKEQQKLFIDSIITNPKILSNTLIKLSELSTIIKPEILDQVTALFTNSVDLNKLFVELVANCSDKASFKKLLEILKTSKKAEFYQQLEDLGGDLILNKIAGFENMPNDLLKLLAVTKEQYALTFKLNTSVILKKLIDLIDHNHPPKEIIKLVEDLGFTVNKGFLVLMFADHHKLSLSEVISLNLFGEVFTKVAPSDLPMIVKVVNKTNNPWTTEVNLDNLIKIGFNQWQDDFGKGKQFLPAILETCADYLQTQNMLDMLSKKDIPLSFNAKHMADKNYAPNLIGSVVLSLPEYKDAIDIILSKSSLPGFNIKNIIKSLVKFKDVDWVKTSQKILEHSVKLIDNTELTTMLALEKIDLKKLTEEAKILAAEEVNKLKLSELLIDFKISDIKAGTIEFKPIDIKLTEAAGLVDFKMPTVTVEVNNNNQITEVGSYLEFNGEN